MTQHRFGSTALLASALALTACDAEPSLEYGTDVLEAINPSTCGNGVVNPGEICLQPPVAIAPVPAAYELRAVEAGRFDADPHADVAGTASSGDEGRLRVRLGDGTGAFPGFFNATDLDTEFTDLSMFDMNGDGLQDMVIASADDDVVHVRLRTGAMWAAPTIVPVGDEPVRVHAADLDGNGLGDFVSLDRAANAFSVVLQIAPGVYSAPRTHPAYGAENFALDDCDGNGAADISVPILAGAQARLVALRNFGGVFTGPRTSALMIPMGALTRGIATGDLNGDGRLDAVVTADSSWAIAAVGNGDCRFKVRSQTQTWAWTFRPELADLDSDGNLDLIAPHGNDVNSTISVAYGLGNGALAAGYDIMQSSALDQANETSTADFNGDGALDLAIASNSGIFLMLSAP